MGSEMVIRDRFVCVDDVIVQVICFFTCDFVSVKSFTAHNTSIGCLVLVYYCSCSVALLAAKASRTVNPLAFTKPLPSSYR